MSKTIHIKVRNGDVSLENAPNTGSVEIETSAEAVSTLAAELNGKYGLDFLDRPSIVIPFSTEDEAEAFITWANEFQPGSIQPDADEEMLQHNEEKWNGLKEAHIKPKFERVGSEVVCTREEPVEQVTNLVEPFAPVFADLHIDVKASFAFARTLREITQEKKHPLFYYFNGGVGDLAITLDENLVSTVTDTFGMGEELPGKVGKIAYKMFKKLNVEAESDDITTLPETL